MDSFILGRWKSDFCNQILSSYVKYQFCFCAVAAEGGGWAAPSPTLFGAVQSQIEKSIIVTLEQMIIIALHGHFILSNGHYVLHIATRLYWVGKRGTFKWHRWRLWIIGCAGNTLWRHHWRRKHLSPPSNSMVGKSTPLLLTLKEKHRLTQTAVNYSITQIK